MVCVHGHKQSRSTSNTGPRILQRQVCWQLENPHLFQKKHLTIPPHRSLFPPKTVPVVRCQYFQFRTAQFDELSPLVRCGRMRLLFVEKMKVFFTVSLYLNTTTGPLLRQNTSKRHASQSKGPGPSRLTRHPHTCVTHMADVLGDFGPKKCGGSGSSSSHTQRRRRSRRRKAKWQYGADRVHVEIKCCRHSVEAKWQFGADKLKAELLAATVPGYSDLPVSRLPQSTMPSLP